MKSFWRNFVTKLLEFLGATTKQVVDHGVDRARKELHDRDEDPNRPEDS